MKAKSIEEFFGTLQQATVETWKEHLKTDKYSSHIALNEFYEGIVELVDALIEEYMGKYGKVTEFKNIMTSEKLGAVKYLEELQELVTTGRAELIDEKDTELHSDIDAILSLISSTLYKLKELKEHKMKDLSDFIKESLNERIVRKSLYECLEDYTTQAVISAWDESGIEFTHKELKEALAKLAKEYDVDKHLDWTKDYMK